MKLLVIAPSFPDAENKFYGGIFIKEQLIALSKHVDEINVINPIPFSMGALNNDKICKDYSFKNINVYFPRFFHLPLDYFREKRGEREARVAEKVIRKNEIDFDIIHAHFTWPSGHSGSLLKRKFGKPLIVTAHGSDVRIPLKNKSKKTSTYLKKYLDLVIYNSDVVLTHHEEIRDILINYYKNFKYKFKYFLKGINLRKFNPNSEELIKKRKKLRDRINSKFNFVVLFLSNLNQFKDPITYIKAADIVVNQGKVEDCCFLMVGTGELIKQCRSLVKKLGLGDHLLLLGPSNMVEVYYAVADIYCALSPVENIWSTTLQEAFCMGKPCIITNVGYTKKTLRHLEDAFLIEPKNPEALAKAILVLKDNVKLRNELSRNVLSKWRSKFDINTTIRNLLKIYRNIC